MERLALGALLALGCATPTRAFVYVGAAPAGIHLLELDLTSGSLAPRGVVAEDRLLYGAWDDHARFFYALEPGPGGNKVVAFQIDARDGRLTRISEAPTTPGLGAAHLAVGPGGRHVYVAHFKSGHVTQLPVLESGGVAAPVDIRSDGKKAHMVVVAPGGRFLFIPYLGSDIVGQYAVEASTGRLTPNEPHAATPPGAGPRHMAFHPGGRLAYTMNELDGTMTAFRYDPAAGKLHPIETVRTVPERFNEDAGAHVLVHPSGKLVYGSNRRHNSIAIFSIDEESGRLTFIGHETAGGTIRWPEDFAMDPQGRFLLVANGQAPALMVFRIGPDGHLRLVGAPAPIPNPGFVGVIPCAPG